MSRVLLLGAGFSRNWNGWLANEVRGGVLQHLGPNDEVRCRVQQWPNFEDALSDAQEAFRADPAARAYLEAVQGAVTNTFADMNRAFANRPGWEFSNMAEFSVTRFLNRFDAIFTLNQDLLFELHYNNELADLRKWGGHHYPGMQVPPDWRNAVGHAREDRLTLQWRPANQFQVEQRLQPIYKLHGSVNWRDAAGGDLLILGGEKALGIQGHEVLRWYLQEFERHLLAPDTQLMVIGYGFGDQHINDLMYRSWRESAFRWFIVHPEGSNALEQYTRRGFRIPNPLAEIPQVGESRRPLSTTFRDDEGELVRLNRFFN